MSAFVDTNILVRHLTGDPPAMAARATAYLRAGEELLLTDLVAAETVHVLESFFDVPRVQVAEAVRSLIAFDSILCVDPALLLRSIEVYETERIDFAEGYLVACPPGTLAWRSSPHVPWRRGIGREASLATFLATSRRSCRPVGRRRCAREVDPWSYEGR